MRATPTRLVLVTALSLMGCLRPAEDHADLDRRVGVETVDGTTWRAVDGLAAVRSLSSGEVSLWSASPVLPIEASLAPDAPAEWTLEVANAMPDAVLTLDCDPEAACSVTPLDTAQANTRRWRLTLVPGGEAEMLVAPPDADEPTPFRIAVVSDFQDDSDSDDVLRRIDADPTIRFILGLGDIVQDGTREEMLSFQQRMTSFRLPYYASPGNHDVFRDPELWHELFGPFTSFFVFKGVFFSNVDSSAATIDPDVYDRLEPWLARGRDDVHVFATTTPPFDPVGVRSFAFRSRVEAAKLLNLLAEGRVDVAFYAHLHTYAAYQTGGVPAYIAAGGTDEDIHLDGIERFYLTVDITPGDRVEQVGLVRVDE